jgi:site-specific DNA-methyltransferase (adenine-specific)
MGNALPLGQIPVIPFNNEDAVLVYEAELVENIHRADLTWQEKALSLSKFHELQVTRDSSHTMTDTAALVFKGDAPNSNDLNSVRKSIHLGDAIKNDYELAMAKTPADAMKIIAKREQASTRLALAASADLMGTTHDLRLGDSFELVKSLPDASIDVVVTDPPYGVDMDKKGTWSVDNHDYDDSAGFVHRLLDELPDQLFRVMKPDSHGYIFCDWRYFSDWQVSLAMAGFRVWQRPIIWYKGSMGAFVDAHHGPRYTHEYVCYFMKGDRKIAGIYDDVVTCQQSSHNLHPAGKPAKLFQKFLEVSGLPGQTALDLFGGGGTMIEAAHAAKMKAVVFELNPAFHAMCVERLTNLGAAKK